MAATGGLTGQALSGARARTLREGGPSPPRIAWAILFAASGEEKAAGELVARNRSRVRDWLAGHPLAQHAPQLRARAKLEELEAHPAELKRILERPDILATGLSAATVGLVGVGEAGHIELYAPERSRSSMLHEHALRPASRGNVRVRWVPESVWSKLPARVRSAPRAAILVDLLESDDPRARREAARALRTLPA